MSHTFATLEVSRSTFREIADLLRQAGYDQAFVDDAIDMHGIGLVESRGLEQPVNETLPPWKLTVAGGLKASELKLNFAVRDLEFSTTGRDPHRLAATHLYLGDCDLQALASFPGGEANVPVRFRIEGGAPPRLTLLDVHSYDPKGVFTRELEEIPYCGLTLKIDPDDDVNRITYHLDGADAPEAVARAVERHRNIPGEVAP